MTGIKIDEVNANILRRLLSDSRTSFTELSKENNITIGAVISRYKNLKKTGLIKDAIMQVNPYRLGLNCIGYLGLCVGTNKCEELNEILENEPYVFSTWNRWQKFNIGCFIATPNIQYFKKVTEKLNQYSCVKNTESFIHIGFLVGDHPENLIIRPKINIEQSSSKEKKPVPLNLQNKSFIVTPELEKIDKIDRTIAKTLSNNARTPFRYIAKKLVLSTSTVIKRYQILKKENLFLRSTLSIDLRKLGYKANARINFSIKSGKDASKVRKELMNIPNLIVLTKTLKINEMFAIIPIRNIEEFFKIKALFHSIIGLELIQIRLGPLPAQWPHNFFSQIL